MTKFFFIFFLKLAIGPATAHKKAFIFLFSSRDEGFLRLFFRKIGYKECRSLRKLPKTLIQERLHSSGHLLVSAICQTLRRTSFLGGILWRHYAFPFLLDRSTTREGRTLSP
jgi:hypothetical protein